MLGKMFGKKSKQEPALAPAAPAAPPAPAAAPAPSGAAPAPKRANKASKPWENGRLQVQVLGCRGLAAADKSGTSDPFVTVRLIDATGADMAKPHDAAHKTAVVKKNLAPRYSENPFVYDGLAGPLPWLRFEVWDWNAGVMGVGTGSSKSLGVADVKLDEVWAAQPDAGPDGGGLAQWLKLRAMAGGKKGAVLAVAGEVEVRFALRSGTGDAKVDAVAAAEEARWFVDDPDDPPPTDREPNTLRVCVVRARSLAIADKMRFGSGPGSSDPFVTLSLAGEMAKTRTQKKNLEPVWMEVFDLPLRRPKKASEAKAGAAAAEQLEALEVLVEDEGTLSPTFLGRVTISPQSIPALEKDGAAPPTWYALHDKRNEPAADRGALLLACKLVYEPSRDDNEDRAFFDEALDDVTKTPNELRVAVARARGLKAMDAAMPFSSKGKTSDPFVDVTVVGSSAKAQRTQIIKKTLTPVWNEIFTFDVQAAAAANVEAPKEVEFEVWDHDMVGKDFLGLVVLPLQPLLDAKQEPVRGWYPLGEKAQRSGGDGSLGQLMVIAQWRYCAALDFTPFVLAEDAHPEKAPNDLRVALFRGRGLAIKDKNLLSKGGSSDPFVRFEILGGAVETDPKKAKAQAKLMKWKSSRRDKTLDPVWREVFSRELRLPDPDDLESSKTSWSPPVLRCICEDYDSVSSADFMGHVDIALEPLTAARPKVASQWYPLQADAEGKLSSNVSGEIHVSIQWRYNPEYDFDPWADEVDEFPDKKSNELRVALVRGRGLAIKDKPLLWGVGSSDPRVTFSLKKPDEAALKPWKSSVRYKSLEPAWCEKFAFPLDSAQFEKPPVLNVLCEDVDELTSADYMGHIDVELAELTDHVRKREWFQLVSQDGASSNVTGDLELIVQWAYNAIYDFDPWADDEADDRALLASGDEDPANRKAPNELCIALVQGRNLAIKDKPMLWGEGSSDPRAKFIVVGTNIAATSKTCSKTLNPSWRQTFELAFVEDAYYEADKKVEFGTAGPILSVTVEDYDAVSGADFMGRVDIPLAPLRDGKRRREWHSLQADSDGKAKSSNVAGDIELILKWRYNRALDFDPFLDEDLFPDKPANEVLVGLAQARNLAVKDKNLLSNGGSSDPRVIFAVSGTELKAVSTTKYKSLNPRWSEVFSFQYSKGPDDTQAPLLEVTVEDVDELTSADFMGRLQLELLPLHDHVRRRQWHALQATAATEGKAAPSKSSSNVMGDVELITRWWYNPAHDFDPFGGDALDPKYAQKAPNELRVALVQARGLAVKDKNLFSKGGSSDPFVRFKIKGGDETQHEFKSTVKKKTLTPVWREIFQLPLTCEVGAREQPRLEVQVEDEDELTASDFMGLCSIDLQHLLVQPGDCTGLPHREWHALTTEENKSQNVLGDVELILQWWYSPALDFSPFEDHPPDDGTEEPNELLVALVQARGLAIKDKNLFSKGGSSDPRVTFKVTGTDLACVSAVKYKTLTPRWCETFSLPFSPGSGEQNPFLDVVMDDVDELTGADFMGRALVELEPLRADRKVHRAWHALQADAETTGLKASSNVLGEVELVLCWRFNEALAYNPFEAVEAVPEGKEPNELALALVQARNLPIADKNLVSKGGTSDPVVRFRVFGGAAGAGGAKGDDHGGEKPLEFESTVVRKTTNPMWKEVFTKPFRAATTTDAAPRLECVVEDWDEVSARDFMGGCSIDLTAAVVGAKPKGAWFPLGDLGGKALLANDKATKPELELVVCWRFNAALDFDPFRDADATPGKQPNELRIGLSQARDLAIKDKNLISSGGSSDPRVRFEILPATSARPETRTSTHRNKTLNPSWRETFALECLGADAAAQNFKLRCVCEDYDGLSSADFLGAVDVDLADLADQRVRKRWYDLAPNAEVDKSTNVSGALELVLHWWYNAALDYDPFPEPDEYPDEPRNELRVCVVRGRNLAIKDKNLLSKGGTSDPRVTLTVGESLKRKTKTLNKTLDPVWKEIFTLPLSSERPAGAPAPTLRVECEDVDTLSAADSMGDHVLDLEALFSASRAAQKVWCPLKPKAGSSSTNVTGEVEVVVQWRHNASRAFSPFKDDEDDARYADREPNELRIGLFQASGLKIMDKNLLSKGGTSDPRVKFRVKGTSTRVESTVQKKTLDPMWKEVFVLPVPRGPGAAAPILECLCEDVDSLSAAGAMGACEVDLEPLLDKKVQRVWKSLGEGNGDLELVLHWRYNVQADFCPFEDDDAADPHLDEEPNELRIALIQARGLAIMDKNVLSAGGSSDPRIVFDVGRLNQPFKSHSKPKTLDPVWHEQFVRAYAPPPPNNDEGGSSSSSIMTCTCEDVDSLSSADKMGTFKVDLAPLAADRKVLRKWYALEGGEGHVELALQWWYNPVEAFDPFAPDESEKPANELRVGLFRARGLAIADKNLLSSGGSSDPQVRFSVRGTATQKAKSTHKARTLEPVWKEVFAFHVPRGPDSAPWPVLDAVVEDWDEVSGADKMGTIAVDLEKLYDKNIVKQWYPVEGGGEVELVLQWRWNLDLDYDPFSKFVDEWQTFAGKEPNELRIALFQARNLAAKDKNLTTKNSSDPRLTFSLVASDGTTKGKPFKSGTKTQTLEPVWREQFAKAVEMPKDGVLKLRGVCEDVDEITAADYMGEFEVDLAPMADLKVARGWYELKASSSAAAAEVSGHVEVIIQWGHEPALAFDPFADADPKFASREPNQLRIGLSRARDLAIADANLLSKGGSSDPRVRFSVPGNDELKALSTYKSKTLEPVWKEVFEFNLARGPAEDPAPRLHVLCEDYDAVSPADPMGDFEVDLAPLVDHATRKEWHALSNATQGEVELVLQWRYSADLDFEPFKIEDDEHPEEEPNELRVAVVRAMNLPALDHNIMSKDSSDPRCVVRLSTSTIERKTKTHKQTLEPLFKEQFIWAVAPSSGKTPQPTLHVRCEDVDSGPLSKNDLIGDVEVELASLVAARPRYLRKWHKLSQGGAVELITQWRHNPANHYAPFADPKRKDRPPNELKIALSQGRELVVKDKNLLSAGGTSDPYVKFALTGTSVKFASTVKEKTLDPVWRETWSQAMPKITDEPLPKLEVACFDYDALTSSDPMGKFEVDLEKDLEPHTVTKRWFQLAGGEGEVELVLLWRYSEDLDYDPFGDDEGDEAKYAHKAPNEVRVAVSQGRNLAIKDKNLLSAGGTSDPRLVLTVIGGTAPSKPRPWKTKTVKKSLNPRWREVFTLPLERGAASDPAPVVHARVEDVDDVSSADFMGAIKPIDLTTDCPNQVVLRRWHSLETTDSVDAKRASKNVHGDVELFVQWRFNPILDFDPFDADDENPFADYEPNELRVALVQGRDLVAMDSNLLSKPSSDPRVTFTFGGETFKSHTQKATLEPVWKEQWVKPLLHDETSLKVRCEDVDTLTAADLMGEFDLDLAPFKKDQKVTKVWYALEPHGALQLVVQVRHNPARERDKSKAQREAQKAAAVEKREAKAAAAEAERKRRADADAAAKADEDAARRKRLEKEAAERRRLKAEADAKRKREQEEADRLAQEAREKRQAEADARRAAAEADRQKARSSSSKNAPSDSSVRRKGASSFAEEEDKDRRRRLAADEANVKARKRREAAEKDAADRARRLRALEKRRRAEDEDRRRLEDEEAARRRAAAEARDRALRDRREAELRRRADEAARLASEERRRKERASLARQRRLESEAQQAADEDARRARDDAYRADLAARRAEALRRQTAARLARETDERASRERQLRTALADGSRNWAPPTYGSKQDAFVATSTRREDKYAGAGVVEHEKPFLVDVPPPAPSHSSSRRSSRSSSH